MNPSREEKYLEHYVGLVSEFIHFLHILRDNAVCIAERGRGHKKGIAKAFEDSGMTWQCVIRCLFPLIFLSGLQTLLLAACCRRSMTLQFTWLHPELPHKVIEEISPGSASGRLATLPCLLCDCGWDCKQVPWPSPTNTSSMDDCANPACLD